MSDASNRRTLDHNLHTEIDALRRHVEHLTRENVRLEESFDRAATALLDQFEELESLRAKLKGI